MIGNPKTFGKDVYTGISVNYNLTAIFYKWRKYEFR